MITTTLTIFVLQLMQIPILTKAHSDIQDVILEFNLKHKTQINIFINLHQKVNTEVEVEKFEDVLIKLTHLPKLIKTDMDTITPLQKMFTEQSLTVAWITWKQLNATIAAVDRLLWKLHYKDIVFICPQPRLVQQDLSNIFEMCWKHGFTSVLVWLDPQTFYTYHPYPSIQVKRLANVSEFGDKTHLNNFHLYHWPQPAVNFPPRFSTYTNRQGQLIYSGYLQKIVSVFLTHHNGSINYYFYDMWAKNISFDGLLKIGNEIGFTFVPTMSNYVDQLLASYPLYLGRAIWMVPSAHEIDESLYLLIPFDIFVWLVILFTGLLFFLLGVATIFKETTMLNVGKALLDAFGIIMFLEVSMRVRKTNMNFLLNLLFLFTGFFLTNYYNSSLSSLYTSKVYGPQLEYLADIERTNLRLYEYSLDLSYYERFETLPSFIRQRFYVGNDTELFIIRQNLNMSFIYAGLEDVMDYFMLQQLYLKKPIAKKLKETFYYRQHMVHMAHRSPLLEQFNRYIFYIRDSGLLNKFVEDSYWEGVHNGNLRILLDPVLDEGLKIEYFQYAFACLITGLAIALVIFVVEIIWRTGKLNGIVLTNNVF